MGLKSLISIPFAKWVVWQNNKWINQPHLAQKRTFQELIRQGRKTAFGKDHHFDEVETYEDFKRLVPIREYEELNTYIERIRGGEANVLWIGKPIYFSKTSGTTSGAKYIPITKESIPYHIKAARDAILHYIAATGKASFVDGKMIFLQGSPELDYSESIPIGRLSGIVAHHVPGYLQKNRLPSLKTNSIDDWERKVEAICRETIPQKMSLISGIPPWVQMYFEKLLEMSGKSSIAELFPDFSLFIYGGVNYEPYRQNMERLIGKRVDSIELYPASEGFISFQDSQQEEGMLLLLNSGIFYEFIEAESFFDENPERVGIEGVELGKNYVIILTTNAGLWGYNIGDTVRFVSLSPYRIVVSGRIKHYTSAFGEHIIGEEAERAISYTCRQTGVEVVEFHLAPQLHPPKEELPYHEWFIEFEEKGIDTQKFAQLLHEKMQGLNSYYKDLVEGKMLQHLKITALKKGAFNRYMHEAGKLGGQNKLPRLANDRKIAEKLIPLRED